MQTLHSFSGSRGSFAALALTALLAACGGGESSQVLLDNNARVVAAVLPGAITATQRDAVRLADHGSFGATEALVAEIRASGSEAWVAKQLTLTGSRYASGGANGDTIHTTEDEDFCADKGDDCWRDYYSAEPLVWDFYRNAVSQPDQLRQRVAFALAQILVVSAFEVEGTYGFRNYHNVLLQNAFTNYREVLRRVILSPVMGEYLDHVNNDKISPNENFGRELLQLFSVGVCQLNPDGTLVGGKCAPTYDNVMVRNYAYALTGWTYPPGGKSIWGCFPENANCRYFGADVAQADMVGRATLQDDQPRNLLGGHSIPAVRTPTTALNTVLDSLMNHPSMAPFICKQLIQHLVKSNPTAAYVQRVGAAFTSGRYSTGTRNFGTGSRGDLAATVAAILLDSEALNSAPPLVAEKLREPALMMAGIVRALNGRSDGSALSWWWGQALRQHVFHSPSVFNFYPPNFPIVGTRLVGPAFGVYNVNTAFARLNYLNALINWGGIDPDPSVPGAIGTSVDLSAFEADADDAVKLVDRLAALATGGRMTAATKEQIVAAVNAWDPEERPDAWRRERTRTAAYLVFASPAYEVLQ